MAHKAQLCNQHNPLLLETPFGELMQEVLQPTLDGKADSATCHLNLLLPKAAANFVNEQQKSEYAASPESCLYPAAHRQSFTLNEPGLEFSEKQLRKAWDKLNHDQQELLRLYVSEGLSCAQIAERKQQSHIAIRRALGNAYARLLLQVDSA